MTSRELIKAVLAFQNPPRVGMMLPAPYINDHISYGRTVESPRRPLEPRGSEARRWLDEWGNTWASLTNYDQGEVVQGAIDDWSKLESYQPPDLGRLENYQVAAKAFAEDGTHFRMGNIPGCTFNVARYIRKLENYLCDLLVDRERINRLNAIVRAELLKSIDCWAKVGADGIFFPEDWGTQDRLMISPAMWREMFKPEFRAVCGRIRDHGMSAWMHSCGKMTAVIPDLIECGMSVLQFDQFRLHGIEHLGKEFGGKITFMGPVDIQRTLQTRDARLIEEEARLLIQCLGCNGGGFIAGYYGSNQGIGLTEDVQDTACKAFTKYGIFRKE
jgi:hypothetical protein